MKRLRAEDIRDLFAGKIVDRSKQLRIWEALHQPRSGSEPVRVGSNPIVSELGDDDRAQDKSRGLWQKLIMGTAAAVLLTIGIGRWDQSFKRMRAELLPAQEKLVTSQAELRLTQERLATAEAELRSTQERLATTEAKKLEYLNAVITASTKAITAGSQDPSTRRTLIITYLEKQAVRQAQIEVENAISLDPTNLSLKSLREELLGQTFISPSKLEALKRDIHSPTL